MTHYELDHSHKGHPVETCHPVAERMSLHVEYIAHVPEREEPLGHKGKNVEEADPSYHTQIESNRRTVWKDEDFDIADDDALCEDIHAAKHEVTHESRADDGGLEEAPVDNSDNVCADDGYDQPEYDPDWPKELVV